MPRRATAPVSPPPPRRAFAAALVLSLGGLVIAGMLVRVHVNAHSGLTSFCDLGAGMSCDAVALSPHSIVLGLPVAVWGLFGYLTMGTLSALGLRSTKPHPAWPAGLLVLTAVAAVAAAVPLVYLSEFVIRSFCIMCAASWALSAALLVTAWLACRPAGVRAAIAADLRIATSRPAFALGVAIALLVAAGAARAAYPRYWERKPLPPAPAQAGGALRTSLPAPGSELVVLEFSDFECPFCAMSHEETKRIALQRPGVRFVSRHFPLSSRCNPALTRDMHESACEYARAAICAEGMGKGEEMADALFANQQVREPLEVLVARVGLDAARMSACMKSKETEQRLAADVQEGIRLGLRATPSFVVNGVVHSGRFPTELLR